MYKISKNILENRSMGKSKLQRKIVGEIFKKKSDGQTYRRKKLVKRSN